MRRERINIGMRIGLECAGCVEKKKETIEHLLNECVELGEGDESREEILNEDGRGIEWMKKVEWRRGTKCGEGYCIWKAAILLLF
jgi:hypothetical protein